MPPLTEQAHQIVGEVVLPGDVAIDATAGNGHDTVFLAGRVGATGRVYSLDIQAEAIEKTRARLLAADLANVELIQRDHAGLADLVPTQLRGSIRAIVFNLGFLPGGDKSIITRVGSTVKAIRSALDILMPGGVLTVIAYPGHPGGAEEAASVAEMLQQLDADDWSTEVRTSTVSNAQTPLLFVAWKSPRHLSG